MALTPEQLDKAHEYLSDVKSEEKLQELRDCNQCNPGIYTCPDHQD